MSNNQNTNNNTDTKKSVKMYASLALYALLGLALGYAVAKGVLYLINRPKIAGGVKMERVVAEGMTSYTGTVSQAYEGDNKATISFDHNKTHTVSQGVGAKSKYFYVSDAKGMLLATIYMSYEGGRGYSADDYVKEVLLKAVPSAKMEESMIHGSSTWLKVSSTNSLWHVKESDNKQWVALVENTKANDESVKSVFETFNIK